MHFPLQGIKIPLITSFLMITRQLSPWMGHQDIPCLSPEWVKEMSFGGLHKLQCSQGSGQGDTPGMGDALGSSLHLWQKCSFAARIKPLSTETPSTWLGPTQNLQDINYSSNTADFWKEKAVAAAAYCSKASSANCPCPGIRVQHKPLSVN